MKLTYRGIEYETESSSLEVQSGGVGGKYRGREWNYKYPRHIPDLKRKIYKQYRGVAYGSRPVVKTYATITKEGDRKNNCCPVKIKYYSAAEQAAKIHLENITRNLERRIEVAKAKGDKQLINLLEKESKELAQNTQ